MSKFQSEAERERGPVSRRVRVFAGHDAVADRPDAAHPSCSPVLQKTHLLHHLLHLQRQGTTWSLLPSSLSSRGHLIVAIVLIISVVI